MATKKDVVRVRLSVEEKAGLVARCARDSVSVSEYVRALIRENEEGVLPGGPARMSLESQALLEETKVDLVVPRRLDWEGEDAVEQSGGLPSAVQVAKRSFTPDFK